MKKLIIPLIVCIAITPFLFNNNSKEKLNNLKYTTEAFADYYVLKDYNGRVALFINNNDIPKETYEIFTNSLPPDDVKKLKNGIIVANKSDLQTLLEDYIS